MTTTSRSSPASAVENHWSGVILTGCVRDVGVLAGMDLGVKALASTPRKSTRRGEGQRDVPIQLAGVSVTPGDWIIADEDGVILAPADLLDGPT
jgi:regulator of ribonuclease activity A